MVSTVYTESYVLDFVGYFVLVAAGIVAIGMPWFGWMWYRIRSRARRGVCHHCGHQTLIADEARPRGVECGGISGSTRAVRARRRMLALASGCGLAAIFGGVGGYYMSASELAAWKSPLSVKRAMMRLEMTVEGQPGRWFHVYSYTLCRDSDDLEPVDAAWKEPELAERVARIALTRALDSAAESFLLRSVGYGLLDDELACRYLESRFGIIYVGAHQPGVLGEVSENVSVRQPSFLTAIVGPHAGWHPVPFQIDGFLTPTIDRSVGRLRTPKGLLSIMGSGQSAPGQTSGALIDRLSPYDAKPVLGENWRSVLALFEPKDMELEFLVVLWPRDSNGVYYTGRLRAQGELLIPGPAPRVQPVKVVFQRSSMQKTNRLVGEFRGYSFTP